MELHNMLEFVVEEVEDLAVTLLEELRARPTVILALGAAVVGALLGGWLAERSRPKPRVSVGAGSLADLAAPLAAALGGGRLSDRFGEVTEQAGRTTRRAARSAVGGRDAGSMVSLMGLALRLLQNPIVRGLLISMIARRVRRR
jgi:hypothetical protein